MCGYNGKYLLTDLHSNFFAVSNRLSLIKPALKRTCTNTSVDSHQAGTEDNLYQWYG